MKLLVFLLNDDINKNIKPFFQLDIKNFIILHLKNLNERISKMGSSIFLVLPVLEKIAFKVWKRRDFWGKIYPLENFKKEQNL